MTVRSLFVAALLLAATGAADAEPEGISAAEAMDAVMWNTSPIGGPFVLTDHDGIERTDADFEGKIRLVYFGFSFCPDICPIDLAAIGGALNELGEAGVEVQPLFISLDSARDRPNLKIYLEYFHPRILGLVGDDAAVRSAANEYKVYYRKVPGVGDDYTIDHTAYTYLFDSKGIYRGFFPPGSTPAQIADAIRPLLPSGT